jgi:hypothetical protein
MIERRVSEMKAQLRYNAASAEAMAQMGCTPQTHTPNREHVKVWNNAKDAPLCYALINLEGGELVRIADRHTDAALRRKALEAHMKQPCDDAGMTWDEVARRGRGIYGETILHVAFLLSQMMENGHTWSTPCVHHRELIAFLVERYSQKGGCAYAAEKFLDAPYTHPYYKGAPLIHSVPESVQHATWHRP